VEGPSADPEINALRLRQQKNFLAILMLSHGVPMLLAGDEFGRTQRGNNNAYCQDNDISWMNWDLAEQNGALVRFTRELIAFRKASPLLRRRSYNSGLEVRFHGVDRDRPDWSWHSRTLAIQMSEGGDSLFLVVNAWEEPLEFALPRSHAGKPWRRLIDTTLASPDDIVAGDAAVPVRALRYLAGDHSVCLFTN
jgi:glycogen operon protein